MIDALESRYKLESAASIASSAPFEGHRIYANRKVGSVPKFL